MFLDGQFLKDEGRILHYHRIIHDGYDMDQ